MSRPTARCSRTREDVDDDPRSMLYASIPISSASSSMSQSPIVTSTPASPFASSSPATVPTARVAQVAQSCSSARYRVGLVQLNEDGDLSLVMRNAMSTTDAHRPPVDVVLPIQQGDRQVKEQGRIDGDGFLELLLGVDGTVLLRHDQRISAAIFWPMPDGPQFSRSRQISPTLPKCWRVLARQPARNREHLIHSAACRRGDDLRLK